MSKPKVSIVTVFYNREELVEESMQSLVDQNYDSYEVIAVDDGSSDGTLSKLLKFESEKVKILPLENGGFVRAIKLAIESAQGEYIAVHGSGDISHPSRIAKQSELLDKESSIGVVGCVSEFAVVGTDIKYTSGKPFTGSFERSLLKSNCFHHGEVMYRKSIYDKVGGYRELFKFAQDKDLWCRMSHHCDFSILNDVLYTRFVNQPNSVSENPKKTILQRKLANFASYCHKCRLEDGYDPLDKEGIYALIDFFPKTLGKIYFRQALKNIMSNSTEYAEQFLFLSVKQRYIPAYILLFLYRVSPKLIKNIITLFISKRS